MARIGVGWDEVAGAAEELKNEGLEPTVDRVRERLGTGSKSTIAPLLKRWRTEQGDKPTALPDEVLQAVAGIHQRLQALADQRVDAMEASFSEQREQWQSAIDDMQQQIRQLEEIREQLESRVTTDEYEKIALRKQLEEVRLKSGQLDVQLQERERRCAEQSITIDEQRQELRDVRAHFEHYQQQAAAERLRERQEHQQITLQMQEQLRQQGMELESARQDRSALLIQAGQQEREREQLRSQIVTLEQQRHAASEEALHEQQKRQDAENARQSLAQELDDMARELRDQQQLAEQQRRESAIRISSLEQQQQLNDQLQQQLRRENALVSQLLAAQSRN